MADLDAGTESARELLRDAFSRVRGRVEGVTDGLGDAAATYRLGPQANTISWLLWHLTRIQDDHLADVAGTEQIWTSAGWAERFALPFDDSATGFGHNADDVARVAVGADLLAGYHADVHAMTLAFVDTLTRADLSRVVDTRWDPPVTLSARLVSVVSDCLQHLGQAAYVRGLAEEAV